MSRVDSPLNNSQIWCYSLSHRIQSATVTKWIDSWATLQFGFILNLFSCFLTTNLSQRNNRGRVVPQTLFNFRMNGNKQWIPITFLVYSRNLAATRDVHSTATWCKWLAFRFTSMMKHNQSANTACWVHNKPSCTALPDWFHQISYNVYCWGKN